MYDLPVKYEVVDDTSDVKGMLMSQMMFLPSGIDQLVVDVVE